MAYYRRRHRHSAFGSAYIPQTALYIGYTPKLWFSNPIKSWCLRTPMIRDKKERKLWFFYLKNEHGGRFHEKTKAWIVPESVNIDALKATIAEYYGPDLDFIDRMNIPPPLTDTDKTDYYAMFCEIVGLPTNGHRISRSEAKRHYILTVKRLHPDVGGDADRMSNLNVAWQKIEGGLS